MQEYQTVNLLMVDDDTVDVKVFQRSLAKQRITNPLHVACNGEEALELLRSGRIAKPLIIILDLNMPRMNGVEFLQELRDLPDYKDSVVFVMTTSDADADKIEAYKFNVAGYMVKSDLGDSFVRGIELLNHYWKAIQLPV